MKHKYVILTPNSNELAETKAVMSLFPEYTCVGTASNFDEGLDLVLEQEPSIVILDIDNQPGQTFSLLFISELHRFLSVIPKFIVTASNSDKAYSSMQYGVFDYWITPFRSFEARKTLLRFTKEFQSNRQLLAVNSEVERIEVENSEIDHVDVEENQLSIATDSLTDSSPDTKVSELSIDLIPNIQIGSIKPLIVCVKSYGDYRFIEADQIQYLQADNNSTDIHLMNGEMVTAFKTLKHFESVLPHPFVRIHNSYIVNADLISRIHLGNNTCYLKDSNVKLPFSKSYKERIDLIIDGISGGNYLEV